MEPERDGVSSSVQLKGFKVEEPTLNNVQGRALGATMVFVGAHLRVTLHADKGPTTKILASFLPLAHYVLPPSHREFVDIPFLQAQ